MSSKDSLTPSVRPEGNPLPAELAEMVDAWPKLAEPVQSAILAIIRSSRKSGKSTKCFVDSTDPMSHRNFFFLRPFVRFAH
jgi:hypothetical protein